jgi:hypothetical protein
VFNHLREQLDDTSQSLHKKTSNPRLEFISRFLLYGGLVRYYNDMKVKDKSVLEAVKITA